MKKKFTIETREYNLGRNTDIPYIAIIDPANGWAARWGSWIGSPGEEGLLEIVAQNGDIIMAGHKWIGWLDYYFVNDDLSLEKMGKATAIKRARARMKLPQVVAAYEKLFSLLEAKTVSSAVERVEQLLAIESAHAQATKTDEKHENRP